MIYHSSTGQFKIVKIYIEEIITLPKLTPAGSRQVMTSFFAHVHTSSIIGKESPVNDVYDDVCAYITDKGIPFPRSMTSFFCVITMSYSSNYIQRLLHQDGGH